MGVKFKDIATPEEIKLKDLEGRTIAIDAYNTIYQVYDKKMEVLLKMQKVM